MISCGKDEMPNYDLLNSRDILVYIEANDLDATESESGLFYIISKQGDGFQANENSAVTISYKGYYLNGKEFNTSDEGGVTINLQDVMPGLSEGISFFKEGGEGTLIIPSKLAYGYEDYKGVPAGSVVIFDIKLIHTDESIDIKNDEDIAKYILDNNLEVTKSETGLQYVITKQGEGKKADENSTVTIYYKGYYLNGDSFDESTENGATFNLANLIPGFKEGVTYFNEGGEGTLIIPARLGYGYPIYNDIPANSVLLFDIKLLNVK